ncbi:hypothetical protein A9958_13010 (plasmid) [Staphylococcus simulans]|uniref:hypothetical protein n=1 Tax=Staphylococcus simulans TaxID=1286 RepID=UPI000D0A0077|nr:hypothetical protein [Staphylococcus simulans]AVO03362.1 hypothetical protein BI282_13005 [Staphylococcus simulans]AVO06374.1 hypothetical protein BI283_13370 [Staphylococcus simulans]AWG19910.1 hypothetical protein A9958_13010 [Staphylococcus simulans]AWI02916.1 hypothetical protein A7X73_13245 [Staphylococcus simulans]
MNIRNFTLYEITFLIISMLSIITVFLNVADILKMPTQWQYLFQAMIFLSLGITTIRKMKVSGIIAIIASIIIISAIFSY